ncbi:MAG: cobalt-precorrin-5B (C(1))-methyltransferase CbiD [Pseudanabaenaceae cyanobacterium SKYGB_i_bin29]|nr:cobalt-precorrin-5B (C(1))-methyltransferase CbiD [Pseudanabaenaceae cyanobacterium SKYG29]MDW8421089.1 cobalt-precorrin-5B (C(1))-methyltransferase CbiD [Pseudanabaenaceae cyanobacterium SKYGB_i_bin29]
MAVRTGYTLPVFAIASGKAALLYLLGRKVEVVELDLLTDGRGNIPIAQVIPIDEFTCLATTISDPGDNLDLTAGMTVAAWVKILPRTNNYPPIRLEGGEGIGKTKEGAAAIYRLTYQLADANLLPLVPEERSVIVRFILPEGREIAKRTSNQAFGILEGLSLLGTTAIAQPLSVEDKLEELRADLRQKAQDNKAIVFYIGANSYGVAQRLGYQSSQLVQTANWLGVMLVEAALLGVESITLIGYHGKLIKLAGGIFNTSSHIADGRIDILVRAAVRHQLPFDVITRIESLPTADAVHQYLQEQGYDRLVFSDLAQRISERAKAYIHKYADRHVTVTAILCDRLGNLIGET